MSRQGKFIGEGPPTSSSYASGLWVPNDIHFYRTNSAWPTSATPTLSVTADSRFQASQARDLAGNLITSGVCRRLYDTGSWTWASATRMSTINNTMSPTVGTSINGKQTLEFTSSQFTIQDPTYNNSLVLTGDYDMYFVGKVNSSYVGFGLDDSSDDGTGMSWATGLYYFSDNTSTYTGPPWGIYGPGLYFPSAAADLTKPFLLSQSRRGGYTYVFENFRYMGAYADTVQHKFVSIISLNYSGFSPAAGTFGEFILYNRALTQLEQQSVLAYLTSYWGVN